MARFSEITTSIPEPPLPPIRELIAQLKSTGVEVFDFSQALVNLPPSSEVIQFLASQDWGRSDLSSRLVEPIQGLFELRKEIANYRRNAYDESIGPQNVVVTAGANSAFDILLPAIMKPGDKAILFAPYFFNHHMLIKEQGGYCVIGNLDPAGGYNVDLEKTLELITDDISCAVIVNPNNPTGTLADPDALRKLATALRSNNSWLIIDETYIDFTPDGGNRSPKAHTALDLDNTVLIGSFSKSLSLAGWRIGYMIAAEELVSQVLKCQDSKIICPGTMSQSVALEGLTGRQKHFEKVVSEVESRKKVLMEIIQSSSSALELSYDSDCFFLFAKIRSGNDCELEAKRLLQTVGIATLPGKAFGSPGYLRFACGMVDSDHLSTVAERLSIYH